MKNLQKTRKFKGTQQKGNTQKTGGQKKKTEFHRYLDAPWAHHERLKMLIRVELRPSGKNIDLEHFEH